MLDNKNDLMTCSLSYTFNAIGGKWKPFIIWYLHATPTGICRYGELKRKIPWDITHKVFAQQLQELEDNNIITRTEYDEKPARVEYSLTEQGKFLVPVFLYMRDWGVVFGEQFAPEDLKRTLGTQVDGSVLYDYASETLGKSVSVRFDL